MKYDSVGRMVLNVEPNVSVGFVPEPPAAGASTDAIRAWRYQYNVAGDLLATSDARGCGADYFYDGAGRLLGEDYAPCEAHHAPYSPPVRDGNGYLSRNDVGLEVVYLFDAVPTGPDWMVPAWDADENHDVSANGQSFYLQGALAATSVQFLLGKAVGVIDRGSRSFTKYDGRGRVVETAVGVTTPGQQANGELAGRFAPRWYVQAATYDAADRAVGETTGARTAALTNGAGESAVQTAYSRRGTVQGVSSSYAYGDTGASLVSKIVRGADGLLKEVLYGDKAGTTTVKEYDDRRRLRHVMTYRGPPASWSAPSSQYVPTPAYGAPGDAVSSFQLLLQDEDITYDMVNNPVEIRDHRIADEWPAGAKPVHKKVEYDDLYRVKRVDYEYSTGDDTWVSPFEAEYSEASGESDPRRARPSPTVSFSHRIRWQTFNYDWLGNTSQTHDDADGFYDRSLGDIENGALTGTSPKPYQLTGAELQVQKSRDGWVAARYDAAGYMTRLDVQRDGPCLGGECSHRFAYRWDEVGRLVQATRYDVPTIARGDAGAELDEDSLGSAAAELHYAYDSGDQRVLKTAVDTSAVVSGANERHTVYIFGSLELRRARFDAAAVDYERTELTEVVYLLANGVRLGRVVYDPGGGLPTMTAGGKQHVFFELGDHLGSTSVVLDKETGELVERSTYQAYGAAESDYRPGRWKHFREDYRFTGKEEDVEVGLQYFGFRYYSPYLGRWASADPLAVHSPGEADLNVYAYVSGGVLASIDPHGLEKKPHSLWSFTVGLVKAAADTAAAPINSIREAVHQHSEGAANDQAKLEAAHRSGGTTGLIGEATNQAKEKANQGLALAGKAAYHAMGGGGVDAIVDLAKTPAQVIDAATTADPEEAGYKAFAPSAKIGMLAGAAYGGARARVGSRGPAPRGPRSAVGDLADAELHQASKTKAATVAVFEEAETGRTFGGRAGGELPPEGSRVRTALDAVPEAERSPFHGSCAEVGACYAAEQAGAELEGGRAAAARVRGSRVQGPSPAKGHGEPHAACSSCRGMFDNLGVTEE